MPVWPPVASAHTRPGGFNLGSAFLAATPFAPLLGACLAEGIDRLPHQLPRPESPERSGLRAATRKAKPRPQPELGPPRRSPQLYAR